VKSGVETKILPLYAVIDFDRQSNQDRMKTVKKIIDNGDESWMPSSIKKDQKG